MLLLGCLVASLLGVAPSHEIQKGVAGYLSLVALLLEVTRLKKALPVTCYSLPCCFKSRDSKGVAGYLLLVALLLQVTRLKKALPVTRCWLPRVSGRYPFLVSLGYKSELLICLQ
jgi:hypothetical protein